VAIAGIIVASRPRYLGEVSNEDVATVRSWLDAAADWFNSPAARPEGLTRMAERYFAPDVTYEEDPVWPDAGVYRGPDAVTGRFVEYRDLMHLQDMSPGKVIDAGDSVLAEVRIEMLGSEAGKGIEFLWTYTVRLEDDRITQFRAWYDPDEAARAAGMQK
jgi:ketosteroid isomerase-like protein